MPDIVPDMPDMPDVVPDVDVPDMPKGPDMPNMPKMPGMGGTPAYKQYYADRSDFKGMRVFDLTADTPEEALEWYEVMRYWSHDSCKSKRDGTRLSSPVTRESQADPTTSLGGYSSTS
jgi:hypothetical protein